MVKWRESTYGEKEEGGRKIEKRIEIYERSGQGMSGHKTRRSGSPRSLCRNTLRPEQVHPHKSCAKEKMLFSSPGT